MIFILGVMLILLLILFCIGLFFIETSTDLLIIGFLGSVMLFSPTILFFTYCHQYRIHKNFFDFLLIPEQIQFQTLDSIIMNSIKKSKYETIINNILILNIRKVYEFKDLATDINLRMFNLFSDTISCKLRIEILHCKINNKSRLIIAIGFKNHNMIPILKRQINNDLFNSTVSQN